MTQLTINIEDKSILPHLKKILNAIDGVSIAKPERKKHKCGLDEALADIKAGRVYHAENVDDMFEQILGI
ncbi:MAG: response regulator [Muribaculaceae bacterium]|nr:response regulator [Muribaculaceae bacterium]